MELRAHISNTSRLSAHSDQALLAAALRMVELAESAIPNLSVSRTLTWLEVGVLAREMRPIRRALESLSADQTDMAAALHVDRVLPVLDGMLSSRLWALSPPLAEEWRELRLIVFGALGAPEVVPVSLPPTITTDEPTITTDEPSKQPVVSATIAVPANGTQPLGA